MYTDILVSVIIPAYNRAQFLTGAVQNILEQNVSHIEIIIVDDGSTDDTNSICKKLSQSYTGLIKYLYQENAGAGAARAAGLRLAVGKYIAFFDSDDYWTIGHLTKHFETLESTSGVSGVYSNAMRKELSSNKILDGSVFHENDNPRPFMKLKNQQIGDLHIIEDDKVIESHIHFGLYAGFQTSTFRREVFKKVEIPSNRIGQDRFFFLNFLLAGFKIGYLEEPSVFIFEHQQNSSSTSYIEHSFDKKANNAKLIAEGYLSYKHPQLNMRVRRALVKKAADELFWGLGYNIYGVSGHKVEALKYYLRAIRLWPWNVLYWKTLLSSLIRSNKLNMHR